LEDRNKLALIVSYYLSKYDLKGIEKLGYKTYKQAFETISNILSVKATTIKNMRDDFDPLHPNKRVGWYQRELRPSRLTVVEKFGDLSEESLTSIVKDILYNNKNDSILRDELKKYKMILDDSERNSKNRKFTTRGITGIRAEKLFIENFESYLTNKFNFGDLIDKRYDGCGYDFEIDDNPKHFFEVKGLMQEKGSISFTDKEWSVAIEKRRYYHLILISNIQDKPKITIITDPSSKLNPKKEFQQLFQLIGKLKVINYSIIKN